MGWASWYRGNRITNLTREELDWLERECEFETDADPFEFVDRNERYDVTEINPGDIDTIEGFAALLTYREDNDDDS